MVNDLMKNYLKMGLDSTEVKKLLGNPIPRKEDNKFSYELGYYRDLDPVYLDIDFDDKGKIKLVKIKEI
jgi:hypothetical protein